MCPFSISISSRMVAVTVPAARIFGSSLVPSRFHCSGEILPATLMIACATVMPSGWGHSGVAGVSGGVGSGPDGGTGVISADLSFSASDLVSRSIIAEESLHLAGWEWRITSVLISTMAGRRWQSSRRPAHRTRRRLNFVWDCSGWTYLLPELLADLNTGHNIVATVFEECRSMYRANGPVEMRPVGEVEFVAGIAAMSASGGFGPINLAISIEPRPLELRARRYEAAPDASTSSANRGLVEIASDANRMCRGHRSASGDAQHAGG